MTVDVTTLALAVDSSQVSTAASALDRMAAAGTRAEGAAASFQRTASGQSRTLAATGQAASKTALSFRTLEEAQQALGPKAAAALDKVAGDLSATQSKVEAAATSLRKLGNDAQAAGAKASAALAAAASAPVAAAGGAGGRPPIPPAPRPAVAALPPVPPPQAPQAAQPAPQPAAGPSNAAGAAAQKVAGATAAAAAGVERLREAEQALALADAKVAASQAALTSAVARNAQAQQNLATVSANSASTADQVAQAQARAASANAALLSAQAGLTANQQAAAKAAKTHQDALAGLGKQAGLTAFQQQQIGFQLHDFAVQVISGQSPLTALVQQGSQLSGTFGGAGNAFKAVIGLLTPMRVLMAGAAATVGTLALAMAHAESSARDLAAVQAQLSGTGRSDLFSTKELRDFIAELALAPGVTRDAATAIVSELARFHDIGAEVFKDVGRLAVDYAAATGQKVPEATRDLARAFADPERGAKALDQALGALSAAQLLEIERMTRLGDVAGAQRVLLEALQQSIGGLAQRGMTPLQQSTNELGNAWERLQRSFGESEGLKTLLGLLAKTIDGVTWLVNNAPKLGSLPTLVQSVTPGGQAAAVGRAGGSFLRHIFGLDDNAGAAAPQEQKAAANTAGPVANLAGAKAANAAATKDGNKAVDDEIKGAIEVAKAYKSQATQIKELTQQRERLNKALEKSVARDRQNPELRGTASPETQALRAGIAGFNERIASVGKRGQGAGGNEAQQVLDAQLEQRIKAARAALENERDQLAFNERFLQGQYQAGEVSLTAFYERKAKIIQDGVAAQVAALEKERADVTAHLEETRKTSPKDKSAIVKDETRLKEIDAEEAKARREGGQALELANQEKTASFRQLNEQVLSYLANLKQLQGDEAGAAKIRADIAIEQARILARQSQGSSNPITPEQQAATERALQQTNDIAAARTRLGVITQSLAVDEQRIAMLQQTGRIGELEALQQVGAARAAKLASLEKEVALLEQASRDRPLDFQLRLDTSRARLELDSLKAQLDPLQQRFDSIFRDSGASAMNDLFTGKFAAVDSRKLDSQLNQIESDYKRARDRISNDVRLTVDARDKALAQLDKKRAADEKKARQDAKPDVLDQLKAAGIAFSKQVSSQITGVLAKELSTSIVGSSGVGGLFADLFGGDKRKTALQASIDTSGVSQSLTSLRTAGIDPATEALDRLAASAGSAADALPVADQSSNPALPLAPLADGSGQPGDFARFDRTYDKAVEANEEGAKADQRAAGAVTQLANAAARGGNALSALPSILSQLSASMGSGGNPGNLIGSALGYLFGGGSVSNTAFGSTSFADALAGGLIPLSTGGYTGDVDVRKAAGVVHGKEFVFSAPATAAIGRDKLELAHELAKAGDGNALASIVTTNLFAGKPGYMAGGFVNPGPARSTPDLPLPFSTLLGGPAAPPAAPPLAVPAPASSPVAVAPFSLPATVPQGALSAPDIVAPPISTAPAAAPVTAIGGPRTTAVSPGFVAQPLLESLAGLRTSPFAVAYSLATMGGLPTRAAAGAGSGAAPGGHGLGAILRTALGLVQPGAGADPSGLAGFFGSPATIGRSLLDLLQRERDRSLGEIDLPPHVAGARALGGPVSAGGLYRVNEGGPELLESGGAQYLMMGRKGGNVIAAEGWQGVGGGEHVEIHVHMPPGGTRQTGMQAGAEAARQLATSTRRNGKR